MSAMEVLYDNSCPLCKNYCNRVIANKGISLTFTDARSSSNLLEEATNAGFDLDKGFVIRKDKELFFGASAAALLAQNTSEKGPLSWINRFVFSSQKVANVLYPLGKLVRAFYIRICDRDEIRNLKPRHTLSSQLGSQWDKLNPNIKTRFSEEPAVGEEIVFSGKMLTMRNSFMGRLFSFLTQAIGNPLAPRQGSNVPAEVSMFTLPNRLGVFWRREYRFSDGFNYSVTSCKQENRNGEMLECVGGGFGMKLKMYVEDGDLHFQSYRYFWRFLKFDLAIPHWLTPGETHVVHSDLGGGRFTFTILMKHKILGETFYQYGEFFDNRRLAWN